MNLTSARLLVAGTETLAGAALLAEARRRGLDVSSLSAAETADWTDAAAVEHALAETRPDIVFVTAGESGGIAYNQAHPARLLESNLRVVLNVVLAAARMTIPRLLYLASSCCHPRNAAQPLRVESLMTGPSSPPTPPMPPPSSPASKPAGPSGRNPAWTISPPCPPPSTAPKTTSTPPTPTSPPA